VDHSERRLRRIAICPTAAIDSSPSKPE